MSVEDPPHGLEHDGLGVADQPVEVEDQRRDMPRLRLGLAPLGQCCEPAGRRRTAAARPGAAAGGLARRSRRAQRPAPRSRQQRQLLLDRRPGEAGHRDAQRRDAVHTAPDGARHGVRIGPVDAGRGPLEDALDRGLEVVEGVGPGDGRAVEVVVLLAIVLAHEQQPVVLGMGEPEVGVGATLAQELVERVVCAGGGQLEGFVEAPEDALHHRQDQRLLVREVAVDRRRRDADRVGHGADGDRVLERSPTSSSSAATRISSRSRSPSPLRDRGRAAGVIASPTRSSTGRREARSARRARRGRPSR